MVTPLFTLLGPKSFGLPLILLSYNAYVNHRQILLTYSSKYFQNLTTTQQLHCFYCGPSPYLSYLTPNSFWHPTLPPHNLFFSNQSFPSETWILWSKPCINFPFYLKSKSYKGLPSSRGAGPFNTSLIICNYVPLPRTISFGPSAVPWMYQDCSQLSRILLSLRYPCDFSSSSPETAT